MNPLFFPRQNLQEPLYSKMYRRLTLNRSDQNGQNQTRSIFQNARLIIKKTTENDMEHTGHTDFLIEVSLLSQWPAECSNYN